MKKLGIVVAGGLLSIGAFAADDGLTLSGYIDAGYTSLMQDKVNQGDGEGKQSVNDMNGFGIQEGGLFIGKKWGNWEAFGDLAFGSYKVADEANNFKSQDGNTTTTTDLNFVNVEQVYIAASHDNGLSWKLGKFDGLFGYYSGRSHAFEHNLTDMGYLQNYLPATEMGWAGTYAFSDMLKVTALVANGSELQTQPLTAVPAFQTEGTRSPDFGLKASADFDMFNVDLGALFMTGDANAPNVAGQKDQLGYAITALIQGKLNPVSLGVYGLYYQAPYKMDGNTTNSETDKADFGFGANVSWDQNTKWGITARGEYVLVNSGTYFDQFSRSWFDLQDKNAIKSVIQLAIGPHYNFNDNITAKVDYEFTQIDGDNVNGTTVSFDPIHSVNAALVAHF